MVIEARILYYHSNKAIPTDYTQMRSLSLFTQCIVPYTVVMGVLMQFQVSLIVANTDSKQFGSVVDTVIITSSSISKSNWRRENTFRCTIHLISYSWSLLAYKVPLMGPHLTFLFIWLRPTSGDTPPPPVSWGHVQVIQHSFRQCTVWCVKPQVRHSVLETSLTVTHVILFRGAWPRGGGWETTVLKGEFLF